MFNSRRVSFMPGFGAAALLSVTVALGGCDSGGKEDAAASVTAPPAAEQQVVKAHAAADMRRDVAGLNVDEETSRKGAEIFGRVCAQCHAAGVARAPQLFILEQMAPESIYRALTEGVMQVQTQELSLEEKAAVSEYLTKRKIGSGDVAAVVNCDGEAAQFDRNEPPVFDGWGFEPGSTHFIPAEKAGIDRANVGTLKLKWAMGFPNAVRARSQPALAGGALFLGSHSGTVYALDRETGCARWTFSASSEVRTGIVISPWQAGDAKAEPLLYFGDLTGNAYAVKAFSGELVWRQHMDDHPATVLTGTPTLHGNTLFVPVSSLEEGQASRAEYTCCTFRGSLVALDAATGAEKWRRYFVDPPVKQSAEGEAKERFGPSGAPMWTTAAVDEKRGQLYVTTGDNYSTPASAMSDAIIALAMDSGEIRWVYQALEDDAWNGSCDEHDKTNCPEEDGPDFDFGAGPALTTGSDGREYLLAGQKSAEAYALDPETGKLIWKKKVGRGGVVAGIHFGIAVAGDTLFAPVSDVPDGKTYDIPPRPGMFALDIRTGEYVWEAPSENICEGRLACHPGYSGAITATPELVLAGANDGWLRIYDAADGKVLWELDTTREWDTINGVEAKGGSMGGGAAPVAYQGMLFMNSGYGFAGKMPGNVLLAFEVEKAADAKTPGQP